MTADASPVTTAAPARRSGLGALPMLVLVLAVLAQAVLMASVSIDRQSGSGFAMFSSVDFAGSRGVVVIGIADNQSVQVSLPSSFDDELDDLRYAPTNDRAASLARDLIDRKWQEQDDRSGTVVLNPDGKSLDSITVVVHGLSADGRQLSSTTLAQGDSS